MTRVETRVAREIDRVMAGWIRPDWHVTSRVRTITTTRLSGAYSNGPGPFGMSLGRYAHFNLAEHVGDRDEAVSANRVRLLEQTQCQQVQWMDQVHGTQIFRADSQNATTVPPADGAWTECVGLGLAVLTADCLPVVVCDTTGSLVGIAHAGWRGLISGVLQNLVEEIPIANSKLSAWIGPGITSSNYEVGEEVVEAISSLALPSEIAARVLRPGIAAGKFLFSMRTLAVWMLNSCGVGEVGAYSGCSYGDDRFYSYRRDGVTGRMATVVWIQPT